LRRSTRWNRIDGHGTTSKTPDGGGRGDGKKELPVMKRGRFSASRRPKNQARIDEVQDIDRHKSGVWGTARKKQLKSKEK